MSASPCTDLLKTAAAAGAALGASMGAPVPGVGPFIGGAIGAAGGFVGGAAGCMYLPTSAQIVVAEAVNKVPR
jgi:hypothetical protein